MTKAKKPAETTKRKAGKDAGKGTSITKASPKKPKAASKTAVKAPAKTADKVPAKIADKAPAKTAVKAAGKAPAKVKAAIASETGKPAKTAKAADAKKPAGKVKSAAKTEQKEKAPVEAREAVKVPQPDFQFMEKKIPPFASAGLAVTTGSKKPSLSVAPAVMILGRSNQAKTEQRERVAERKLSRKELVDIQTALIEKRERLLAGMRRELAVQRERAESKAADDVDKATDAYDGDLSFEIATANDQELSEIQVALEKIEKGTYGECEVCGCTISPSRLKILPSATTCVACRGQEELSRRRDDSNLLFSMMNGEDGDAEAGDL